MSKRARLQLAVLCPEVGCLNTSTIWCDVPEGWQSVPVAAAVFIRCPEHRAPDESKKLAAQHAAGKVGLEK